MKVKAFIRTSKAGDDKPANVRFRLSDGRLNKGGIQLFHKSEITVLPEKWDEKAEEINARVLFDNSLRKKINKAIRERKTLIENIYGEKGKTLTSEILETEIDKARNPEKYETQPEIKTLFEWTAYFIKTAPTRKDKVTGRPFTYSNIQQYKATEKHLKAFAKSIKKQDFDFSEVDGNFYDRFVSYLQALNFTQNSVGKHIKVLKTMLNEATAQNINTYSLHNQFHVFTEETDTIYLNENELQKIKDADLSKTLYLDRVRDWFLLLAWTGCRFSDLNKITKTDIKNGFITFRQQKTNNKVTIPLHPIVTEILEKYDYDLPDVITNQKFNEYIKEVCCIAEINSPETTTRTEGGKLITSTFEKWEHVTSHTGRRSFCTNMYKRGVQSLTIMSISGHKTEKSFLKYIKVKQEEHAELMKKAWDSMYK
ncbi:MAG: site-specific integrase [Lentimicrobiaceae bacterium]|nr:site-specific integrase [Lentimicrobiaceae bacterium]